MPELPEVENFRQLLLPLVSKKATLRLTQGCLDKKPPRKFLSPVDIQHINEGKFCVSDVLRRGKQLCLVLNEKGKPSATAYLLVHMGMTGRISTPDYIPGLESLSDRDQYPPPHTYLTFEAGSQAEASFSDPRKFGAVLLVQDSKVLKEQFYSLAPDAWTDVTKDKETNDFILEKLANQKMGIKALLLDQKRAVSGVGNWVADEVLYQMQMHPDQDYLTTKQTKELLGRLHLILETAVDCLSKRQDFPKEWLFHYRWNSKTTTKDAQGRMVISITSGGRTSAIAPSIQKKKSQKKVGGASESKKRARTSYLVVPEHAASKDVDDRDPESKNAHTTAKKETMKRVKVKKEIAKAVPDKGPGRRRSARLLG